MAVSASATRIPAVVVSHLRREVEVTTLPAVDAAVDHSSGETLRCFQRSRSSEVVTGDRVLIERDAEQRDRGVIVDVLPRRSLLRRRNRSGQLQTICANLDLLLIVIAPAPEPHADLIDRYLVAAELDHLDAALVCNKSDLPAAEVAPLQPLLETYRQLGVTVAPCSARTGTGIGALRALIGDRSAALVGQSGVGKSSLLNALLPDAQAAVGSLSTKRNRGQGRGRHTTSSVRLYPLAPGLLIDSPGIRELTPEVQDPGQLIEGFPEIARAAQDCRFRNCRHEQEPDCAVQAALADGRIAASRWHSLCLLQREVATGRH